ncbi:MAG: hypothetical protein Kow0098_05700 [Ignavibacteriaceae bacterium]
MPNKEYHILNQKVNLIYEYNKQTPLYVRVAGSEIEKENYPKAVQILTSGMNLTPNNPVAYILLGVAYLKSGKYYLAEKYFKVGSAILNSEETYDFYMQKLEETRKADVSGELELTVDEINNPEEISAFNPGEEEDSGGSLEERLEKLSKEISAVKLRPSLEDEDYPGISLSKLSENNLIISDTLAKIYRAQGEYDEAIKVYEKLIQKNPARSDYYQKKISEIKSEKS